MSAFIVPNAHVTTLAVFIAQQNLRPGLTVQQIGEILLNENIESVRCRYPDDRENYMGFEIDERLAFTRQSTVQIIKAANCLEYQSCEHDAYWQSDAHKMTKAAHDAALQQVNDSAKRIYTEDNIRSHPDYDDCAYVIEPEIEQSNVA